MAPEENSCPEITVVVCTHNPRPDFLDRVLTALKRQTLERGRWKVALVDNNSAPELSGTLLSERGIEGEVLREHRPGKVNAMAHAARVAEGDWIVFIDDDNVVEPDYLKRLIELGDEFTRVGVMSASIIGEFEAEVPDWVTGYLDYLAVRPLEEAVWSSFQGPLVAPIGAGMCVRLKVFRKFVDKFEAGCFDPKLGRTAGSLAAGTDDTAFMDLAFAEGLGCGAFPELRVTHLIPEARLSSEYLRKLVRDITRAHTILKLERRSMSLLGRIRGVASILGRILTCGSRDIRRMEWARLHGFLEGIRHA